MVLEVEDVSTLFNRLTVSEIQDYERKTRAEIERRKEDLRVMVGERYRDLIEAADTIREMKLSVESVSQHVKNMHDSSIAMNLQRKKPMKHASVSLIQQQYYSVAARVKLLLDIPDKIWIKLENGDLLTAANLYLLAQHIHTSLEIEVHHQNSVPISACFPVVARLWPSVMHFRSSILEHSQQAMKTAGIEAATLAECICAIMCITDSSPQKLCSDFLLARMASLEDILTPTHQVAANVKDQIITLITQIKETIILTCEVFCHDTALLVRNTGSCSGGLLYKVLAAIKDKDTRDLLQLAVPHDAAWAKYLPSSMTGFCQTKLTDTNTHILSEEFLRETCNHWIKVVKDTFTTGVSHILSYINSVKGLSIIQDAVKLALFEICQDNKWAKSCDHLMHKEISLWEDFLSSLFVFRIKAIVRGQFNDIIKLTKQNITSAVNEMNSFRPYEFESNVLNFIWTEGSGDLPAKYSLEFGASRGFDSGNLTMKSKGFTPRVQSICCNLDNQLRNVLEDVGCYVTSNNEFGLKLSINTELDQGHIQSELHSDCCDLIDSLLEYMKHSLGSFNHPDEDHTSVKKALLLANLCSAIVDLCPHIQKAIKGINVNHSNFSKEQHFLAMSSAKKLQKQSDNPQWQVIKQKLLDEKLELYGFWKNMVGEQLKSKIEALVPSNVADIFKHMPLWDLIEIEEENEEGATVKSTISVPMHPSKQIESLLYWMCYEVNKIGGHVIPRIVLQDVQLILLNNVLTTYENYLKTVREQQLFMPQAVSLQLLFDVRFATGLITPKEDKGLCDRIQTVCDDFESFVDPFDLDVFSPYINNHQKRCIQRSLVLFGPLTSSDRLGVYSTARPAYLSHHEQHNVLCLSAGNRIRFTLLPIGSLSTKSMVQKEAVASVVPTEEIPQSSLNKSEKARSISPQRSANVSSAGITKSASTSFFGAMSSSWFGN